MYNLRACTVYFGLLLPLLVLLIGVASWQSTFSAENYRTTEMLMLVEMFELTLFIYNACIVIKWLSYFQFSHMVLFSPSFCFVCCYTFIPIRACGTNAFTQSVAHGAATYDKYFHSLTHSLSLSDYFILWIFSMLLMLSNTLFLVLFMCM